MGKIYAGARIHALRRSRGLTQVAMAKELNLSTSYLNQLENDQRPLTVTVLMQLTQRFDVDASYFSADRDICTISELRTIFPDAEETELAEMAARFPELMPRLIDIAARVPESQELSPYDVVRDFFYDANNYIHELDILGEELGTRIGGKLSRLTRLSGVLDAELGVHTRFRSHEGGPRRVFDPTTRELSLRNGLTGAQTCFEMSMFYAEHLLEDVVGNLVSTLPTEESRKLASYGLHQYFGAAATMPYMEFLDVAESTRYDVDRVAGHFGTGFESTAHRLSTLQRTGARGVPFFFIRTDRGGNISKRASATSFHFSRSGGTCPLWVVHRAFETPNRITRQVASMPDGHTYLWVARMVQGAVRSFGTPRKEHAVALGCDISEAHRLIYSDALNLSPGSATPIGPGCDTCPREECPQRAFALTNGISHARR